MFFIVVEVFGLERVRFESRPLLHVEIVVLYVGFHACLLYTSRAFELSFQTEGMVSVPCDRCLDDMELPISSSDKLMVKDVYKRQAVYSLVFYLVFSLESGLIIYRING